MIGLTDNQLRTVMDAARTVPVEKRDLYLQRIAALLPQLANCSQTFCGVAPRRRLEGSF
jgi:hypothetical protein